LKTNSNKLEKLEEMDKFLSVYDLPKLSQEDINRFIASNDTEAVMKSPSKEKPKNR
jgi:hypothetical protein